MNKQNIDNVQRVVGSITFRASSELGMAQRLNVFRLREVVRRLSSMGNRRGPLTNKRRLALLAEAREILGVGDSD